MSDNIFWHGIERVIVNEGNTTKKGNETRCLTIVRKDSKNIHIYLYGDSIEVEVEGNHLDDLTNNTVGLSIEPPSGVAIQE